MARVHDELCDRQHTPRQQCNSNLAANNEPEVVVLSTASTNGHAPPPPFEAPLPAGEPAQVEPPAEPVPETAAAPGVVRDEPPQTATLVDDTMPAPSPEAVRAWEQTAAGVGATATPAPPPRPIVEAAQPGWLQRNLPLVATVAAASFGILIVARRRR
jgi:hypothetical protein